MQYRRKQILKSKFRRAIRWEFWPMSVFYVPIFFYIVWLVVRYRGLKFLSVNPGLPMSGLIGEKKARTLNQLTGEPELARFKLIPADGALDDRVVQAEQAMRSMELDYPVVLKPDFGQRGLDVAVIRDAATLRSYLAEARGTVLLQEHVGGLEFGVFYMRHPGDKRSQVFSITEKTFPVVVGDGSKTIEQLLMENPRTHFMAEFLLSLHADKLEEVLAPNEKFLAVEIGSHCRGSVFLNGNRYISDALTKRIDQLSRRIDGFHFGRYDIRVPSIEDLQAGTNLKVLEVNGVTSESTNIYDPSHSVFDAYRILFRQWRNAFEIGHQVIEQGAERISLFQMLQHLKKTYG